MKLPHNARKEEKRKERRGRWVHTEIAAPITAQCRRLSVCETCATDALILYHMLYYLVNSTWRWRVLSVSSCALPLRRLQPEKERETEIRLEAAQKRKQSRRTGRTPMVYVMSSVRPSDTRHMRRRAASLAIVVTAIYVVRLEAVATSSSRLYLWAPHLSLQTAPIRPWRRWCTEITPPGKYPRRKPGQVRTFEIPPVT